jgi:transmembrane sensor
MDISSDLIERYFRNQTTETETSTVLQWFRSREGQAYLSQRLETDLEKLDENTWLPIRPLDTGRMLENIYAGSEKQAVKIPRRQFYLKIAASFVLIAIAAYYFISQRQTITYKTAFGQKLEVTLPDSSEVTLNGNSSLTVSRHWNSSSKREVWLKGEAFFSVFHTRNHNDFVVYASDNFNIQVLGTEFNVLNREHITRVALERGNVRLNFTEQGKNSMLTMKPGEFVEFNENSAFLIKKETQIKNITSWKEPMMVFEQTSIEEIAVMLKNTHGVTLIVRDPDILEQKISGTVPNQNLDLFLRGLTEILDVTIKRERDLVYVDKKTIGNP